MEFYITVPLSHSHRPKHTHPTNIKFTDPPVFVMVNKMKEKKSWEKYCRKDSVSTRKNQLTDLMSRNSVSAGTQKNLTGEKEMDGEERRGERQCIFFCVHRF